MSKTFLILGGYGNTGRPIAQLLLKETDVNILIAGRDIERAKTQAFILNQEYYGQRVSAMRVDAAESPSLHTAFAEADLVVVASSSSEYVENVARAAIYAGIDYLDTQLSTVEKLKSLYALEDEIIKSGCIFITDGGFHPGVPAALVRYAATFFDEIRTADVGSVIQLDWKQLKFSPSTSREMIREFKDYRPLALKNGKWVRVNYGDFPTFHFGKEFGERRCSPMFLEELRYLPEQYPSLRETGFYVGGFNWFIDYITIPLGMVTLKFFPKIAEVPFSKLFEWGLNTFSKAPFGTLLQLEASGVEGNLQKSKRFRLFHEDGYMLTAIPVVSCLLQYLEGKFSSPGLGFQANIVEPIKFLRYIEKLGVQFEFEEVNQTQAI
jgi:saccharopine dehydrogenase (NAD+, L-lysine-forming)